MNKVAIVTGGSRGIGRAICLGLAKKGYDVVIAAKSVTENPNLPGTIYSVADEVRSLGVKAMPIKVDMRDKSNIEDLVSSVRSNFSRLDMLVNNAGALWWKSIEDTPIEKYDLINSINSRGAFYLSKLCIPLMKENDGGHIIMQSPPLCYNEVDFKKNIKNKTGYMISKWGMTISALGISEEYKNDNIAANTLWPLKPIESYALINNNIGNKKMWRKQDIIVDCIKKIADEDPITFTGNQLTDEDYLRSKGITDFEKYQCVPGCEPPIMNEIMNWDSPSISKL